MGRPPKPLTDEQKTALNMFVDYDPHRDVLVWRPRKPEHFNTRDPARTAAGFNRARANQPISCNNLGVFTVTMDGVPYQITENKVRAYFGAPHTPIARYEGDEPSVQQKRVEKAVGAPKPLQQRHPHARGYAARNTNINGNVLDPKEIRMALYKRADNVVCWRKIETEAQRAKWNEMLKARSPIGDYLAPDEEATWASVKMRNRICADKPAKVTTRGVITAYDVVFFAPHVVSAVLGADCVFETTEPRERKPSPLTDEIIREVLSWEDGRPVWNPRDAGVWMRLVMAGVEEKMPKSVDGWNIRNVGRPPARQGKRHLSEQIRVGKRYATLTRVRRVLTGH